MNDGDIYGLVITSADGCTDTWINVVNMISPDYTGLNRLEGTESGIADYETNGEIESVQRLLPASIVDYDAAVGIALYEGFEVELGAQFQAIIDGCNNGGGGQNATETEEKDK